MTKILLATDFSATPGGRFRKHGPFSGEEFREDFLIPKFAAARSASEKLEIDFDDVVGLPSSFLEEAFGGLVRHYADLSPEAIEGTLSLTTTDVSLEPYLELITRYMKEAGRNRRERASA